MKVHEMMSTNLVTVTQDSSLDFVEDLMSLAKIRHIPVVNGERQLVGLITHRDLLRVSISALAGVDREEERELKRSVPVTSIMCTDLTTISPGTSLLDATRIMIGQKFGCLPVVDQGALVGILTESDFVKFTHDLLLLQQAGPES